MPDLFGSETAEDRRLAEWNRDRKRRGRPQLSLEDARERSRLCRIYETSTSVAERDAAAEGIARFDRPAQAETPRRRLSDLLARPEVRGLDNPLTPAPRAKTRAEIDAELRAAEPPAPEPAPAPKKAAWRPPAFPDDEIPF